MHKTRTGSNFHLKVHVIQPHERYGYPPMPYGPASFAPVVMLALLLAGEVANAGGPEPVEFREEDVTLKAVVYRPDGAGPFPAVVAMHDCSGLTNAAGAIASKYREWAQLPVRDGPTASESRMPTRRDGGWANNPTYGRTISRCSAGRTAAAACCGPSARSAKPTTSPTSDPRSRSIPVAAALTRPRGAPACQP